MGSIAGNKARKAFVTKSADKWAWELSCLDCQSIHDCISIACAGVYFFFVGVLASCSHCSISHPFGEINISLALKPKHTIYDKTSLEQSLGMSYLWVTRVSVPGSKQLLCHLYQNLPQEQCALAPHCASHPSQRRKSLFFRFLFWLLRAQDEDVIDWL